MRKIIIFGIGMLALAAIIVALGLTVSAGISVNNNTRTITLTSGNFDLESIWADAAVTNDVLINYTDGTWFSNHSFIVDIDAVLEINPTGKIGCTWLKLNRSSNVTWTAHINVTESGGGGTGGKLYVNNSRITGWNFTSWSVGSNSSYAGLDVVRPWIFMHGGYEGNDTYAYFLNSTLGYLGYNYSERYGIVYRDINDTGVYHYPIGWIHNCTILENYIGVAFQGVPNMNVTSSYFNDSKEVGIVYTTETDFGPGWANHSSNNGYVGFLLDPALWTSSLYAGVTVLHINGTHDPDGSDGIRLFASDDITFDDVNIDNCTNFGLRVTSCDNFTANNTNVRLCTNAADNFNIYIYNSGYGNYTNCSATAPAGTADGGNWFIGGANIGTGSHHNSFILCSAWGAVVQTDFQIYESHHNVFADCGANNSNIGFYIEYGHNNTVYHCVAHNHTSYNYKIKGSQFNIIDGGYANTSAVGVLIFDTYDTDISYNNTVMNIQINTETSYAISIGTDGAVDDNICHNNSIINVTITGTTSGDGIFLFDNVTVNHVRNSTVTGCSHANADGMGIMDDADFNDFQNCTVTSSGNSGYHLGERSNNNTLRYCNATSNSDGITLGGDTRDNHIDYCVFNSNSFGVWMWPDAASSCIGTDFLSCTINSNTQSGIDIGRAPLNRFFNCSVYNNTLYGVEVRTGGYGYFFNCVVDNPAPGQYDWYISSDSTVDLYSPYMLGFDRNINFQFDTVQPYGVASHDAGDGIWQMNTTQMTAYCNDGKDVYINITTWTASTIQWVTTGVAGDYVYVKVGGLTAGLVYSITITGSGYTGETTYTAQSGTMLPTQGTTGIIWVNYTGPWSTRLFTVTPRSQTDDSGAGGGGNGDDDDATTTTPTTGGIFATETVWIIVMVAVVSITILVVVYFIYYYKP